MDRAELGNDAYRQSKQSLEQGYLYQRKMQFNLKEMHLLAILFC